MVSVPVSKLVMVIQKTAWRRSTILYYIYIKNWYSWFRPTATELLLLLHFSLSRVVSRGRSEAYYRVIHCLARILILTRPTSFASLSRRGEAKWPRTTYFARGFADSILRPDTASNFVTLSISSRFKGTLWWAYQPWPLKVIIYVCIDENLNKIPQFCSQLKVFLSGLCGYVVGVTTF